MTALARLAQISIPARSPDPNWVNTFPFWDLSQFRNSAGREQRSPLIEAGQTVLTLIVAGQSNHANSGNFEYTPTNALVENLSIFDGGLWKARDPLLGCSAGLAISGQGLTGGNVAGYLGDAIINAGWADRVILVPIAVDASSIQNWAPIRTPPEANIAHRFTVAKSRLDRLGLTADAILWHQGETDADNSPGSWPAGFWELCCGEVVQLSRDLGFTCPWFVCQATHPYTDNATAIRASQAAIVNHGSGIWAGPDTDTLTGLTYRQSDDTHWNSFGAQTFASLWMDKLRLYGAPFRVPNGIELEDSSGRWLWDDDDTIAWS